MSAKLSIITITYQAEKFVERTIQSVISQGNRPEIEYIIIDGASQDGTLAIVEKYRANIDILVSEPDRGIYDAMNKGIQQATGDYLIFMNAGDSFASNHTLDSLYYIQSKINPMSS